MTGQIALGLMRPIVAALDSPSLDGRSSDRPLERGDNPSKNPAHSGLRAGS
jgi:hypothetical protein